jgi:hypothetical protein
MDAEECEAFFKDKDTSKYALVLQQTLDTIRASAEWIEVRNLEVYPGCQLADDMYRGQLRMSRSGWSRGSELCRSCAVMYGVHSILLSLLRWMSVKGYRQCSM